MTSCQVLPLIVHSPAALRSTAICRVRSDWAAVSDMTGEKASVVGIVLLVVSNGPSTTSNAMILPVLS